jgi:hypothetical protein
MKFCRTALLLLILTLPSKAQAGMLLECLGFNSMLKGTVVHYVEIDGSSAKMDGQPYKVATDTTTSLTLLGPMKDGSPTGDPNWPAQVMIDRVNGTYFMIFPNSKNTARDWSRPQDQGCRKATPRF